MFDDGRFYPTAIVKLIKREKKEKIISHVSLILGMNFLFLSCTRFFL
jgi:hypothetical protein